MISCSKCKKASLPVSDGGCIKTGGIVDIGCEYGEPRIVTNADRIRAMTDEEMAEFLYHAWNNASWCSAKDCADDDSCLPCWFEWLKQEADHV